MFFQEAEINGSGAASLVRLFSSTTSSGPDQDEVYPSHEVFPPADTTSVLKRVSEGVTEIEMRCRNSFIRVSINDDRSQDVSIKKSFFEGAENSWGGSKHVWPGAGQEAYRHLLAQIERCYW